MNRFKQRAADAAARRQVARFGKALRLFAQPLQTEHLRANRPS